MAKKVIKTTKAPVAKKTVAQPKQNTASAKSGKKTVKKEAVKKEEEPILQPTAEVGAEITETANTNPTANEKVAEEIVAEAMPTKKSSAKKGKKEEVKTEEEAKAPASPIQAIEDEIIEFGDKIVECINATYHFQNNGIVSFVELQNTVRHNHSKFGIQVVRSANNLEAHIEISYGKTKINFPRNGNYKVF